jgi:hypothetical protein
MAEVKPLGSEKLNSDEKLKRILELTYYNNNKKSSSVKAELVQESKTGGVYGIVREKDAYYVKRGLNEQSLDYIGGMFMKNKNKFSSYGDAFKRFELLKGQDELQEATKYVLKQNKPQEEMPMPEPSMDAPEAPVDDMSSQPTPDAAPTDGSSVPSETPPTDGEEDMGKRSSYMAEAQKYAGKLGQELRDLHDRMESDDIKYILNMIISAVDLDKLSDEDIEDIAKKFEREEEGGMGSEEPSAEVPSEEPAVEPEADMNEYDAMGSLDEFVNTPMDTDEIDLSKSDDIDMDQLEPLEEQVNKTLDMFRRIINRYSVF